MKHKLLNQLLDLGRREEANLEFASFDLISLTLHKKLERWDYVDTPLNVITFARTGVDGGHFSLIKIDGEVTDESPVVMTEPMMFDHPNVIVGANLYEFLCLGCHISGYGYWSNLHFVGIDRTVDAMNKKTVKKGENAIAEAMTKEVDYTIARLKQEFNLKPWSDLKVRFKVLQEKYMPLLEMSDESKR